MLPFVSDAKRQRGTVPILTNAARRSTREWLNAGAQIFHKPLSRESGLSKMANTLLSVVNQDYVGDINILPKNRIAHPLKILHHLSVDDAMKLIDEGERATWRRMEMIRVQTRISRTLERILHDYEEDYIRFHQKPLKKKAA